MANRRARARKNSLNAAAETVGSTLGRLAARVASLKKQRAELAVEIRRVTSDLLTDLGHASETVDTAVRRKISRASKSRWAKKAVKKTRNVSAVVRARLSKLAKERWAKAKKAGKTRLG